MRSLIGGIIAAMAAAVAWLVLEHLTKQELGWLTIAVGLITGCGVRFASGSSSGESYARGALAAVLALAAIVGGRQGYSKVMEQFINVPAADMQVIATEVETVKNVEADSTISNRNQEKKPTIDLDRLAGTGKSLKMMSTKDAAKQISTFDIACLGIAALSAYVVGKGSGNKPSSEEDGEEIEENKEVEE
jgi:hypothetical protein